MSTLPSLARACVALAFAAITGLGSASSLAATYTYSLQAPDATQPIYPDVSWLPDPYKQYYDKDSIEDTVKLFLEKSMQNDGVAYKSIAVSVIPPTRDLAITIDSDDPRAADYPVVHPAFFRNYGSATLGIAKCKSQSGCWNKNNTNPNEPWAFFPQFGLPMVNQKSVLMLNYPPATALTGKDYLNTFTMSRWTRLLSGVGIDNPTLFETIVDVRPIAAPGSGTSDNLPDAVTYFNDQSGQTGGYYITPQLNLMLDPPANGYSDSALPLVILGGPARDTWKAITGLDNGVLNTGTTQLSSGTKKVPYILGNHPDVTTYQCCPGDKGSGCTSDHLIEMEEIDVQIACWADQMAKYPSRDPAQVLASCKSLWVTNRSADNDLAFCALARSDSNECFGKDLTWEAAIAYCKANNNNPCASYACPVQ